MPSQPECQKSNLRAAWESCRMGGSVPRRKWLQLMAVITAVVVLLVAIGIVALNKYFAPLLRKQAIAMLSDRFDSDVEIGDFHASLFQLQVWGGGLVFRHHGRTDVAPLFTIDKFFGDVDITDLF